MSVIGAAGGPFHDPAADAALFDALTAGVRPGIETVDLDLAINDPDVATACVRALLDNIRRGTPAR